MPLRLPLFPLGLVLFPGLVLPLHVFEERYRALVRDLLALPEPERVFGVVAVRLGWEVGEDGVRALHEVGCAARLRRAEPHEDGRYDIVTTGDRRFRLAGLAHDQPYLVGEVEWLDEADGDPAEAELLAGVVRAAYVEYLDALAAAGGEQLAAPQLPDDPTVLSHLVGATMLLDLDDRQGLLAEPGTVARLREERRLLRRERAVLRLLSAVPNPDLVRVATSPN